MTCQLLTSRGTHCASVVSGRRLEKKDSRNLRRRTPLPAHAADKSRGCRESIRGSNNKATWRDNERDNEHWEGSDLQPRVALPHARGQAQS